ncbi:anticodon nuclease [Polaribacter sp. WD7]|uniref:AAA family ATPase n=1 Tax=Polaribacter sp. WD7 TaxID=2269061 RepID=UPI000DF40533|nr:AAA family ATPase [Polaribacter sp. WD7]RCS26163.1 anticodon nuclease [Polaribacter sp. WD7]
MSKTLNKIAEELRDANKKVQLIYAFNGTGKTRLSRELKDLISPKDVETEADYQSKVLYYNAFTEDLFYWNNDLDNDLDRKLVIQSNGYTKWVLQDQGQEPNITAHFQRYTNDKLTPNFNVEFSEVRFSFERGDDSASEYVKISKGEESCFIWSIFYSLLEQAISTLNISEENERDTEQFNHLEYVFIDDPVSSLDDTHLIELAVNIAALIRSSESSLKFVITTHNPLFYNVLYNEFNKADKKRLEKFEDGTFSLLSQPDDSPFSYHLYLLNELDRVIESGEIQKYHFNFLRNILEKTSTFLGYAKWQELLPEETEGARDAYYRRIINLSSHSYHHGEEVSVMQESDKRVLGFLVNTIKETYRFELNS